MSIHGMSLSKTGMVVVLTALALVTTPAWAKSYRGRSSNNLTQIVSESPPPQAPTQLDPSLAMALANNSTEGLANFGASSGTVVGNRAAALREEVLRLRSSVNLNSNEFAILRTSGAAGAVQYHSTVAAITARLQNGTTRGNPILLRQWEEADGSLNEVTSSLNKLNALQVAVDADASVASYLLGSIQAAFDLAGAVDEDHDQLKMLRDEINRLVVQLDYLRNQTISDLQRQASYLTTERSNLQSLAFSISRGEMLGNSLANRPVVVNPPPVVSLPIPTGRQPVPVAPPQPPAAAPMSPVSQSPSLPEVQAVPEPMHSMSAPVTPAFEPSQSATGSTAPTVGHLLVLIRFNQPNVGYEQQLSQAVGQAIERMPNAEFSVVAMAPTSGDSMDVANQLQTAKSRAEEVKRALIQLGLSPTRITLTNTQSASAQSPEVHVYVR